MKINFIFHLIEITVLLFVVLSFIFIILKVIGIITFSWFQVLAPFGLACAMVFIPILVLSIFDNFF